MQISSSYSYQCYAVCLGTMEWRVYYTTPCIAIENLEDFNRRFGVNAKPNLTKPHECHDLLGSEKRDWIECRVRNSFLIDGAVLFFRLLDINNVVLLDFSIWNTIIDAEINLTLSYSWLIEWNGLVGRSQEYGHNCVHNKSYHALRTSSNSFRVRMRALFAFIFRREVSFRHGIR